MERAWAAVVVVALGGCALYRGDADDDGADASPTDARVPDADPFCHWDCFGYSECVDGVVTTWEHTPVPCDEWTGECPHYESYTCERGCRTDVTEVGPFDPPELMCEENRPKHVGDPCAEEADCRPEVATITNLGTVINVYLTCDVAAGQCVERDPPVIADLYATCEMSPPAQDGSYVTGVLDVTTCSTGVCAYSEGQSETCYYQTCTGECASDGECPVGTTCVPFGGRRVCLPPDWVVAGITCQ